MHVAVGDPPQGIGLTNGGTWTNTPASAPPDTLDVTVIVTANGCGHGRATQAVPSQDAAQIRRAPADQCMSLMMCRTCRTPVQSQCSGSERDTPRIGQPSAPAAWAVAVPSRLFGQLADYSGSRGFADKASRAIVAVRSDIVAVSRAIVADSCARRADNDAGVAVCFSRTRGLLRGFVDSERRSQVPTALQGVHISSVRLEVEALQRVSGRPFARRVGPPSS